MLWLKIVLTIVAAYIIVIGLIAAMQTMIIFPTSIADAQAPVLPSDAKRLSLATPDGELLAGIHLPPRPGAEVADGGGDADTLILGFGGNASHAHGLALMLRELYPGAHTVAFHYRGYGESEGSPSAKALLADSLAVHDHAAETVRAKRVIAVGISIGSGVAAYVAKNRTIAGLILITPFDSIEAVAKAHYPWAPVGLLLRHRMPTIRYVEDRPTPTALITAARDRIVPPSHAAALRPAIPNLVFEKSIPEAGHNDIYGHPEFTVAMNEALARIRAAQ